MTTKVLVVGGGGREHAMTKPAAPSYKQAGVDLEVAEALVGCLKPLAESTRTPGVESGLGSFGGFFSFPV